MTSLLDETGPDLYRTNAFRVTGLPVGATARDIRRRGERLRAAARYGVDADTPVLPLPRPPDGPAVQQIVQRLKDPAKRLVDELFWFWPEDDADEAMTALRAGDLATAEAAWRNRSTAVARHNRAVLAHARALDADAPDRALWEEALTQWHAVIADRSFWDRFARRTAELDDPRLASVTAGSVRARLPTVLLSINARLALDAWRDDRRADAESHLTVMRRSGFALETVDEVLRDAVHPDRKRLTKLCEDAERAADADPEHAAAAGDRLAEQAAPVLDLLGFALTDDDPALGGAKDHVARQVMRCAIAYGNRTRDWRTARALFQRAHPIAVSESTAADIARNLAVAEENVRGASCLFCDRPAADRHALVRTMYGQVSRGQFRVTWRTREIAIPRCPSCHARQTARAWLFGLGWAVWAALIVWTFAAFSTPLLLADAAMAVVQWALGPRGLTPRQRRGVRAFDPVQDLLKKGWAFGTKPPGVN